MTQMTISLYDRRKRMLELHYSRMSDREMIRTIAEKEGKTYNTIRMDWRNRDKWESIIWRMEQSSEDVERVLFKLRIAIELTFELIRTAKNENAKVGAIGKLAELLVLEIELRQSLGILPKVPEQIEIEQTVRQKREVLWNELTEEEKNVFRMCSAIRRAHSTKERLAGIH